MSHVQHQSLIVTSWDAKKLEACKNRIAALGLQTTETYKSAVNSYETFYVVPCGSKAGWHEAKSHLEKLDRAKAIIDDFAYDDLSNSIEYFLAVYGQNEG